MRREWINISGNHDRIITSDPTDAFGLSDNYAYNNLGKDELEWLKTLPAKAELPGGILLFHGAPMKDTIYLTETVENGRVRLAAPEEIRERLSGVESPVMFCGHTHLQRIVVIDRKTTVINPGSVGLPAYDDHQPEYHVVESGSPHAKYAIMELENNRLTASLISIPYNHSKAVSRAEKNNRPDWAKGLSAGYMR
jgi:predicted phosphodiesterase